MSATLALRNHHRKRRINARLLRQITLHLLLEEFQARQFELGLHLIGPQAMSRLNQRFLGHEGPTDVITFDHREAPIPQSVHGEIFICLDEAIRQARRFQTRWPVEVVRYLIHGLLHLHGHDDHAPGRRRRMKLKENWLLRRAARRFPLGQLARSGR